MNDALDTQTKVRESIAETSVSVSSETLPEQTPNVALPELGNTTITTEADLERQEAQRILDKYVNDELTYEDLNRVLSTTIIEDEHVKIPLALVELLTLTDSSQKKRYSDRRIVIWKNP